MIPSCPLIFQPLDLVIMVRPQLISAALGSRTMHRWLRIVVRSYYERSLPGGAFYPAVDVLDPLGLVIADIGMNQDQYRLVSRVPSGSPDDVPHGQAPSMGLE